MPSRLLAGVILFKLILDATSWSCLFALSAFLHGVQCSTVAAVRFGRVWNRPALSLLLHSSCLFPCPLLTKIMCSCSLTPDYQSNLPASHLISIHCPSLPCPALPCGRI
jgi:hypothetical protein